MLLLKIFFIDSLGSIASASTTGLPSGMRSGNPDFSKSLRVTIGVSYRICMREESNVDLYAIVMTLPRTIHSRISIFLTRKPSLLIHFLSLLLGMSSVERKKSEIRSLSS